MKDFFYYTKSERQGIALLGLLILALLVLPRVYAHFHPTNQLLEWESFQLDSTYLQQAQIQLEPSTRDTLFPFDPNAVSFEDLQQLGLSSKTAHILLNFRSKGGKFFKKEDLLKVYSLDSNWYYRVEPYIRIAKTKAPKPLYAKSERPRKTAQQIQININSAQQEDWAQLRGIGPVLSHRIVKFRDKLGGFHSLNQVAETYGLPDSTYQKIRPFLVLDKRVQKLAVNEANPEMLAAHPYISWKTARLIINYREMHNGIKDTAQLQKIYGIDSVQLEKIIPYLSFQ